MIQSIHAPRVTTLAILSLGLALLSTPTSAQTMKNIHDLTVKKLDGSDAEMSAYKGKVLLVVNVASRCGLTPQYEQLQALHEQLKDEGLAVLAFPCNQFGKQEPGTADEIKTFCSTKYGVTFDMFSKIDVNGEKACDLYKILTKSDTKPTGSGNISWNFEKFVIDKEGNVVSRFSPKTKPNDPALVQTIKAELKKSL